MKKAIKIFFISLLCLMILAGVLVYMAFGDLVSGALSVKKNRRQILLYGIQRRRRFR